MSDLRTKIVIRMVNFNLKYLSDYRTSLMGIAAIMIILCHATDYGVCLPNAMAKILMEGGLGVDIFLLLSGIGCYYSLSKQGQVSIGAWYKRRLIRILIPYALMQIPYWMYWLCVGDFDLLNQLYEFSTIRFWASHHGAWYVALLLPLYAITPPIYRWMELCKSYRLYVAVVISLLIMIVCYMSMNEFNDECWIDNLRWAFKRTVSFVVGMGIAPFVKQGRSVNLWIILGLCALSYFFVHKFIGKDIFMNWCKVPFLIVAFVFALRHVHTNSMVLKFIYWMGVVSLESYLANIYLCGAVSDFSKRIGWNDIGSYMQYLMVIVLGIILSWMVKKTSLMIGIKIKE